MSLTFDNSNFQFLLILFLVSANLNIWVTDLIFSEKGESKKGKSFADQNS